MPGPLAPMADTLPIETRTFEQLAPATAVSPDALTAIQEPGGPVVRVSIKQLLGRLVQVDTTTETEAELQADLDHDESTVGLVYADPDPAKNGWYRKVGAIGEGHWSQFEKLSAYAAAEIAEYVAQASSAAMLAQGAAGAALAAAGVVAYADIPAGLGATVVDETFWIDNNDGTGIIFRHDDGPVATEIGRFIIDTTAAGASGLIGFNQDDPEAVAVTVQRELRARISVSQFGADPSGATNSTAAFTAARAKGNGYYIVPPGTYAVDADPNVWEDNFVAPYGQVKLVIDGVEYDVSGAKCGAFREEMDVTQRYLYLKNARTGATVARWSDGELTGDSNRFYLPFDIRRDSHVFIASPGSNNGTVDFLWRRSDANADPRGNRFAFNYEEASDKYSLTFATTDSGNPSFDYVYTVVAGTSPVLAFPALRAQFQQGWEVSARSGATLRLRLNPTASVATLMDGTTSNILGTTTRSYQRLAGLSFNTLYDTPAARSGPQRWGGVFSDATSDGTLPVTKVLWSNSTNTAVIGSFRVAATTSGGTKVWRESRFTYDGSTVTITDIVNTLPANFTAVVAVNGTTIEFQAAYSGGLGSGYTLAIDIEWCGAGR